PFDPFTRVPDDQNEDDEWVFPLANPFVYAGNDVIDASALSAEVSCTLLSCNLPSVGFTAYGGAGNDYILGSQTGDHLAGGSGDDEIHGGRGADHIYGDSGVNVNILTRGLTIDTENHSPGPTITKAGFINNGTTIEPTPSPVADNMDAGRDLIYGEGFSASQIGLGLNNGPQTAYDDIIFADHGEVIQQVVDPNLPDPRLQKIQTTLLSSVRDIRSAAFQNGADDIVFANRGRDVVVGGAGNDMLDGDQEDDFVFGDQVFLHRRVVETFVTDITAPGDITSGRFQSLCGDMLYSRTDRVNANGNDECGHAVNQDNSGALLVDGIWRNYRDPDSPGLDAFPWWAEYSVNYSDGDATHHFHDFEADLGHAGAGSFGNDYIAGSEANDMLFGQLGDDTMQGDGGIELAFARMVDDPTIVVHVSASRTPDGCTGAAGVNLVCDYVGDLDIVPSFEAGTDGEDYIEGNGDNDIAFGGLGQDDIIGGSSAFFSLTSPQARPDGDDLLFGGAGTRIGRNDDTTSVPGGPLLDIHARDADTTIGDNGNIVRIVGTRSQLPGPVLLNPTTLTSPRYVTFNYDNYDNSSGGSYDPNKKLVVRGVALIDYTPGGPDFAPSLFFLPGTEDPVCSNAGAEATGLCSTPLPTCAGNVDPYHDIGGRDEVHGEAGDDTVYTGCGNDTIFGDAQDDDLIGGWGNDWISGGTGSDGVLGDDGRIFTSRNSANGVTTGGTACQGGFQTLGPGNYLPTETCFSEPLYGVAALVPTDPDTKTNQGFVLNEFISTPGLVQQATINVGGVLKKQVDVTPYNLGPNEIVGHFQVDVPTYDANNSDDVIFGGWDDDFLHGASGDDAVSGAEAMPDSYVQHFNTATCNQANPVCENGLIRDDWTRPWNPGNLLLFGADDNPWNSPKPFTSRLGEFYLYDEFDPRRPLLFNGGGLTWGCTAFSNSGHTCVSEPPIASFPYQYFLNLVETTKVVGATTLPITEGRVTALGCVQVASNGSCLLQATVNSDGNDVMFGDLGNDWSVGGSGKDEIYAGWGNDLSNADDILTTNGSHNDTTDTHPTYEDRVYGGAGVDVLMGNTFGDRLIDWVGEWDTYLVPFSPFGIGTVSRQVEPSLPEFLYAISASDGADPTRDSDRSLLDTTIKKRNGEPFGEIGLVIQQDQGLWQEQTGGPTDPQSGGVQGGGGQTKTLSGADFNNGAMQGFAVDSGVWTVGGGTLQVAAASLGLDSSAVFYADAYLPVYFEISAAMSTQKPTAGWKSNSYVLFDYWSPTDFKFAGIDISTNQMVIGVRDAQGWSITAQRPFTGSLRYDTFYQTLVAINGTQVTVSVNGEQTFSYTFAPRTVSGQQVGLNKGLVGFGSNDSRGVLDNLAVSAVPPAVTFDSTEYFEDGAADQFTGPETGTWSVSGGRYAASASGSAYAVDTLDLGARVRANAHAEVEGSLSTTGIGGLVFDAYAANDFKYAALDVAGQQVVVGHVDPKRGWVVDATYAKALTAGVDYVLNLSLQGTVVTITLDGSVVASYGFNSAVADGKLGVVARSGSTSVDRARVLNNDDAFTALGASLPPELRIGDAVVTEGAAGTSATVTLGLSLTKAVASATTIGWRTVAGTGAAGTDYAGVSAGTATFAAGSTSASVQVTVLGDGVYEPNETFTVELTSWAGFNLADRSGLVTITNDDAPPVTVSIQAGASVTEGNSGSKTVTLTVTLSSATSSAVTVNYATANGTATAGSDYTAKSGTLTFAAGTTTQTISITVGGDKTKEPNETFLVNLSNPTNATLGAAQATVTIVNDDGAALTAASAAPAGSPEAAALTAEQLDAAVAESQAEWLAADPDADFAGLAVSIGDLDGLLLGVTDGSTVTIDRTAAGWGWSVSGGQMDLRSVLLHELGHVLGLEHSDEGVMAETLAAGEARGLRAEAVWPTADAGPVTMFAGRGWVIVAQKLATTIAASRASLVRIRGRQQRPGMTFTR
ncbi:MAG TPA: Calx-beta domain-containing protein, partial [Gaiellaceae bacterium]|nr:Calx-beta domain-containing protein [Gaiellaceae bacterium]